MLPILLAAFDGKQNPARLIAEQIQTECHKCILPNDKEQSVQLLLETIRQTSAVCVVALGQKPGVRDKIAVEPSAKLQEHRLHTPLDCTVTAEILRACGYEAYVSRGCGSSYCNHLYYACLAEGINGIFLHTPTLTHISDLNAIIGAIDGYLQQIGSVPCAL